MYINFGKIYGKIFKIDVVHYPIVGTILILRQPLREAINLYVTIF
jgi:hypothetical protein